MCKSIFSNSEQKSENWVWVHWQHSILQETDAFLMKSSTELRRKISTGTIRGRPRHRKGDGGRGTLPAPWLFFYIFSGQETMTRCLESHSLAVSEFQILNLKSYVILCSGCKATRKAFGLFLMFEWWIAKFSLQTVCCQKFLFTAEATARIIMTGQAQLLTALISPKCKYYSPAVNFWHTSSNLQLNNNINLQRSYKSIP